MTGWTGDFFRFWWALFYWNTRKTWFRLRGADRDSCPCQHYGDSGLALDSRCEAVIPWSRPSRFRRVCPLLQETPEGWRCAVDAERVRPFWRRAALYAGGCLLLLYLAGTIVTFAVLRTVKYDVSYFSLFWPPRWGEVRRAEEQLYAGRAQRAMAAGNYREAALALEMVCQLNPRNYAAGLALASLNQVASHPYISENIYERLMRDVPEQRIQTAQILLRSLLARSAYAQIKALAAAMLVEDAGRRGAWLNALLFAARKTADTRFLTGVLDHRPAIPEWCSELISIERALLQDRLAEVQPRLTRFYPQPASAYVPYYQVDRLIGRGLPDAALSLLDTYGPRLPPDEAAFLRLRAFRAKGWNSLLESEFERLLQYPMTPRSAAQFSAYLVGAPDPGLLAQYCEKFVREGPALTADTLPLYDATYLASELAHEKGRAEELAGQIMKFTGSDARAVRGLATLLQTRQPEDRLARILPLVPLPLEVIYAVLDYPSAPAAK